MIKQCEMNKILDYVAGGSTSNLELVIESGNHIEVISVLDDAKNITRYEFTVSNKTFPSIVIMDELEMPEQGLQDSSEVVKTINDLLEEADKIVS